MQSGWRKCVGVCVYFCLCVTKCVILKEFTRDLKGCEITVQTLKAELFPAIRICHVDYFVVVSVECRQLPVEIDAILELVHPCLILFVFLLFFFVIMSFLFYFFRGSFTWKWSTRQPTQFL